MKNILIKLSKSNRLNEYKKTIIENFYFIQDLINYYLRLRPFKKRKLKIVTASDEFFFSPLLQLLDLIDGMDDFEEILVYNLGFTKGQIEELKYRYNSITLKNFEFSNYPKFYSQRDEFNKLGHYAWKSSILKEVADNSESLILWLDSANYTDKGFDRIKKIILISGFYSPYSAGNISNWTHERTLSSFPNKMNLKSKRNLTGGLIGIDPLSPFAMKLITKWQTSCEKEDLISPKGSSRRNHRQDQSLLSILFYLNKPKEYFFKTKKLSKILVNQNPNQKFYIYSNNQEKFKNDWDKLYADITTNTIYKASLVLLFSVDEIKKIPKKIRDRARLLLYVGPDFDIRTIENMKKEITKLDLTLLLYKNSAIENLKMKFDIYNLDYEPQKELKKFSTLIVNYLS